jgi:hypothetical protein
MSSTVLIRIAVGAVFSFGGVQKFLHPAELGTGRFAKVGIPAPEVTGPFVGGVEVVCGALSRATFLSKLTTSSRNCINFTYMHAWNLRDNLVGGEGGNAIADANAIQVLQVDLNMKF